MSQVLVIGPLQDNPPLSAQAILQELQPVPLRGLSLSLLAWKSDDGRSQCHRRGLPIELDEFVGMVLNQIFQHHKM